MAMLFQRKKRIRFPAHWAFLGCMLVGALAKAQDLHNSQFYLNPVHLSPATTGLFDGEWRVAGLYRSQWQSVPVSYQTYSLSADWKAIERNKDRISVGLLLQNDQAGDGRYTWGQGGLNVSAAHAIGAASELSAGFGVAGVQRSIDLGRLTFKNQWAGDFFDPSRPSGEPLERSSGLAASLSAGLAWLYQKPEKRTRVQIGLGAFHLNRPVVSLGGDNQTKIPIRNSLLAEGVFQMQESWDLVGFLGAQKQKNVQEILVGAGMRQILSTGLANVTALRTTVSWRLGDAVIPAVQLERNNWILGLSYDWNISSFHTATNGRGGIEIALVWRVVPVKIPKADKCCPVF